MDGQTVANVGTGAAAGSSFGPWGIAIGAGAGLLSGLLSSAANRAAEERKRKQDAMNMGFNNQIAAAKAMTEGEQNAFNQLLQGYRSSVVRGG